MSEAELVAQLVERRKFLDLSQSQVAERMGTSQASVARIEAGGSDVRLTTLMRYAQAVGMRLDLPGLPDLPAGASAGPLPADARLKGRPERNPKGSVSAPAAVASGEPDPDFVLSWRQRKILTVIQQSVRTRGYPPTMREIGAAVGLASTSSVSHQLDELEKAGYIRRIPGQPRSVAPDLPRPRGAARQARSRPVPDR